MGSSSLIGSFQTRVNLANPFGVAGDFASSNPRATALTPDGGALIAGPAGVTIGKFAWVASDGRTVNNYASGAVKPTGFVHRDQQGLLTQYLQAAGMLIPPGFPVTLMVAGDFLAANLGASSFAAQNEVYAGYADGGIYTAAPSGASVTATVGSTNTGSLGSTNTATLGATFTASAGSPSSNLVVTAVTGLISIGDVVSGTGITPGTTILSQVSGTAGGAGTYNLSAANTCSAATVTSFGTVVNVTAVTGLISVGDTVSGAGGFPVGATIQTQISGTAGGIGVYRLSTAGSAYTASATGVTTFGNVLKLTAVSTYVSVGDTVVKSTDFPTGVTITAQLTGTAGSTGTYSLSAPATAYVASGTGVLTFGITIQVTAVGSGTLAVGDPVTDTTTAANVATGAVIASQVSGTPGLTGVYTLSLSSAAAGTYAAGDTLTTTGGIATSWYAKSSAAVGELVQISTWGN
jgi:hypothetical protein